ncbi:MULTISPECIES: hypothetical protein [Klebsiella pneumoniae complex]|uniref:P-loop NTPase n=1 Tax=Klebsiella pneumoniae complex TaxID=3390273 RepID=UPI00192C7727|nr:hypothetical protein [Klebsiella pneumoniae]MBL4395093.1 hypothetical protein [Klebsiella pneumoniae]MCQ0520511.1 hypothetical protein [Klebsiella pneumoniae]HCB0376818.1 hypothetical protein [Klebsiella pneumoniae]HCT3825198.1 hypothetical protein [Klebsiella pneumoniae]HDZ2698650.1 hypothetical protein [Klebsiella pneumoniae]
MNKFLLGDTVDNLNCDALLERLKYGRVFLFLGFDYFLDSLTFNPVLRVISESIDKEVLNLNDLYKHSNRFNSEKCFNEVKGKVDKLPTNNNLDPISKIKWNAIYTSSIDDLILTRLRDKNRVTIPICKSNRAISYSRDELNVFYLSGLYSRIEPNERVPQDRKEYVKRKHEAQLILNNLVDSMSPMDTLIIYGWNPENDIINGENLYQVLSRLSINQAFMFSGDIKVDDEYIKFLIDDKILSHSSLKLPDFIEGNISVNSDDFERQFELNSFVKLSDRAVEIPTRIRRLINHYGIVIEDEFFNKITQDVDELFKDFLFESSRIPVWLAYPNNLDFEREYYKVLHSKVNSEIKSKKVCESPIILHGSTGTGKSISLARLCYDLYKDAKYLLVYINSYSDTLDFKVIDEVCEWAESNSFISTVICWDGMNSIDTYQSLSSYLSSRGRKQIVIGSSYKINDSKKIKNSIEAKEQFSEKENISFKKYLKDKSIVFEDTFSSYNSYFLVTLYRLLPETRFAITSGIVNEANHIKKIIINDLTLHESTDSIIAEAFRKAFANTSNKIKSQNTKKINININDIVDVVMVFGKFGIETPFDLLMRVFPALKYSNIDSVFKVIDIIRWSENSYGEIYLSSRNTLEAEIYCKRIIASSKEHVKILLSVISCVEQRKSSNCPEIGFCADVVRAFGPNGKYGKEYSEYYLDISRALGELLESKKIVNTKLMLLQANLLREYGRSKFDNPSLFYQEYYELLHEALAVIEKAIDLEERLEKRSIKQARFSLIALYGEKASILGTVANQCTNDNKDENVITKHILEAIDTARESFKYNISNYRSLDSIAWIVTNHAKSNKGLTAEKLKLVLDAISIFNEYAIEDLEERHHVDFLTRKTALYETIGNDDVKTKTLEALKEISLVDFHYYMLTKLLADINLYSNATEENLKNVKKALDYIKVNNLESLSSYKINVMRLRLFWFYENKIPLFNGERVVIKKGISFWHEVVDLSDRILSSAYNNNIIFYRFIKAVGLFHVGQYKASEEIFNYLSRDSESISGSRRVFKSFLMADENGVRKFSGEVININSLRNRGEIYIDELKTKVTFLPTDFNLTSEKIGFSITDFHIAFNFLRPTADNEKYFQGANQ